MIVTLHDYTTVARPERQALAGGDERKSSLKTQERVKSQKTGKVKTRKKSLKLIVKNKVKVKNGK